MNKEQIVGVKIPEILLPDGKVNMRKWAVIACDQYTSEPEYWQEVQRVVGGSPSIYHIILPEAYLGTADKEDRIEHAKNIMRQYIEDEVLVQLPRGAVLVERTTRRGKRNGIVLAVDLEQYDFTPGNKSLIRATEETLMERIPPRIELRRGASLESPHIMLLINDKDDTVIGPLYQKKELLYKLYKFDLMQNAGSVTGWFVSEQEDIDKMLDALAALKKRNGMLFAVGDGNHSLATAKTIWDETKEKLTEEEKKDHPLRYALVEVVNLYDKGLTFEPIHRVVFNVEPSSCINQLSAIMKRKGYNIRIIYSRLVKDSTSKTQVLPFVNKNTSGRIEILNPKFDQEIETLQDVLNTYIAENDKARIDYIHGDESFDRLAHQYNSIGFKMPAMNKEDLFSYVEKKGILPQKAFSMGEADAKRFYVECRLIAKVEVKGEADPEKEEAENKKGKEAKVKYPAQQAEEFEEAAEARTAKPVKQIKQTVAVPTEEDAEEEGYDPRAMKAAEKEAKRQAKLEEKEAKMQAKLDVKEAKKQAKLARMAERELDEFDDDEPDEEEEEEAQEAPRSRRGKKPSNDQFI